MAVIILPHEGQRERDGDNGQPLGRQPTVGGTDGGHDEPEFAVIRQTQARQKRGARPPSADPRPSTASTTAKLGGRTLWLSSLTTKRATPSVSTTITVG